MGREQSELKMMGQRYFFSTVIFCAAGASPFGLLFALLYGIEPGWMWARLVVASFIVGGFIGLLAALMNKKRFINPVGIMVDFVDRLGQGDLTQSLSGYTFGPMDMMKEAFEDMKMQIAELVKKVLTVTDILGEKAGILGEEAGRIREQAEQVASAITQVAQGSSEQALAVEEIVRQIRAGRDMIETVVRNTEEVGKVLAGVDQMVQEGAGMVEDQRERMEANKKVIKDMHRSMTELSLESEEIEKIMQLISDIAGQTNLLALNAAIEAARTGEQGRGFAVVAQEVRKLAEQSAEAAKKIGDLIAGIRGGINQVAAETGIAEKATIEQERMVEENQMVIKEVKDRLGLITYDMQKAKIALEEVSQAMAELNAAVEGLSSIAQEGSAASQEVSATAQEQAAAMHNLQNIAEGFIESVKHLREHTSKFKL